MKPRIFIGSSGDSVRFAHAIKACLQHIAECTVWTDGAFGLAEPTMAGLTKNLRDSDFGVFVFAADDEAFIKGELLRIPRDNVVYEAGLFSGYLCPERCLIAVPVSSKPHLPTDLSGMTVGFYEDKRSDSNYQSAVSTFCFQVMTRIEEMGLFKGRSSEELRELVAKFECCQWILDEKDRVGKKKEISIALEYFCKVHKLNKHRLLVQHRAGYYLALLEAIRFRPEADDWELLMGLRKDQLPPGFAYYKLVDTVEALSKGGSVTAPQLKKIQAWIRDLPDFNRFGELSSRVSALVK